MQTLVCTNLQHSIRFTQTQICVIENVKLTCRCDTIHIREIISWIYFLYKYRDIIGRLPLYNIQQVEIHFPEAIPAYRRLACGSSISNFVLHIFINILIFIFRHVIFTFCLSCVFSILVNFTCLSKSVCIDLWYLT